jgi:hypothetical protein
MAAPMAGSLGRPLGCDLAAWALAEIAAEIVAEQLGVAGSAPDSTGTPGSEVSNRNF